MNKKIIIIVSTLLIIAITGTIFILVKNKNEDVEPENPSTYISEVIEDECTEEYEESQNTKPVASTEEKISANAMLVLKKYYITCDHTINEYVEIPPELVNMTKEELQIKYPDWEVIGFTPEKVTLYKEFEDECGEHFKLRIEDGKVVVYIVNEDGTQSLYEKTNISSEYLTETDLINMKEDGLEIYGREELNKIIEDFE